MRDLFDNHPAGAGSSSALQHLDVAGKHRHIRAARLTYNQVRYTFAGAFTPDTNFGKE